MATAEIIEDLMEKTETCLLLKVQHATQLPQCRKSSSRLIIQILFFL